MVMSIARLLTMVFVTFMVAPAVAHAQKLVFVVRHAERADGGAAAPMMGTPADPALSAIGEARAAKLADMLANAGIGAIFSTQYKRTQDTVKPLAARLGVAVTTVPAAQTAQLVAALRGKHAGDIVLVVGHSNTVPDVIKALGGPDVKIPESDYGDLFVLVPSTGALSRIKF